jgi:oxygen-independent coproporphyrinogen-3 oxidase
VHTLSVKKGSCLQGQNVKNGAVKKMVDYGYKVLSKAGYMPYYMYRQKNQLGNLENIGYTLLNKQCKFNVDSMEETVSVIACGANAISKFIDFDNQKIIRSSNPKFLNDYISRLDENILKKNKIFNK